MKRLPLDKLINEDARKLFVREPIYKDIEDYPTGKTADIDRIEDDDKCEVTVKFLKVDREFKKEDIEIYAKDNFLEIAFEGREFYVEKDGILFHYNVTHFIMIQLPKNAVTDKITAKLNNNILKLVIPKLKQKDGKILIKIEDRGRVFE